MKKQFFRVKQLADQKFSRAEKTEVLSDELQDAERRVEFVRTVCLNVGKKIGNSPSSGHDQISREKKLKKNVEYCLGTAMVECASVEEDHLLRQIVTDCGKLQQCLARQIVDHEIDIETKVVDPLSNICENDYPNILKLKKNLSKFILDMDSAKARFHQALKHSGSSTGSKVDAIKEELEEAEGKVEQCRDALACEMLQLISKEEELSTTILEYALLQRKFHEASSAILDKIIPEMRERIQESSTKPVFGRSLEEHLRVTGRKIAYPIELCVCGLLELGIAEEGLFRVAPGASKLKRMKLSLDANLLSFETALQFRDPHLFAAVLKSYLRQLPEPLLTHKLYDQWMTAAHLLALGKRQEGLDEIRNVVQIMPKANFDNLLYLTKFLASLANNKEVNKMTPQNIAIVIAPNLIWSPNEDCDNIGIKMNVASLHSLLVDTLVSQADHIFPGGIDFYITLSRDVALINGHNSNEDDHVTQNLAPDKRAQSNDSLSDQSSPPQGSPKPAVRSRKKPTAPIPPGQQGKDGRRNSKVDERRKSKIEDEEIKDQILSKSEKIDEFSDSDEKLKELFTSVVDWNEGRKFGELDKRTSKSGEDIRKIKMPIEAMYATMERKKPPRPTPAPRTFIDGDKIDKPAIPERPTNLGSRPMSLSFRMNRPSSNSESNDGCLERAHVYTLEKKQVAIFPSDSNPPSPDKKTIDKEKEGDKPEKPKKPDNLVTHPGHQRAASEGSIIDTGLTERRPPRPTPPPPPTLSPVKKEATKL